MELNLAGFDPRRALHYASQLAIPRRVGSEAERAAGEQVAAWLEGFGFRVERQPFRFSNALNVCIALEILLCQALILLSLWLQRIGSPLQAVSALALILLIAGAGRLNRSVQANSILCGPGEPARPWARLCLRMGKRYSTVNVYARPPETCDGPGGVQLMLAAHSDSKSQRLPLVLRIGLFVIGIGGSLAFAILSLLSNLIPVLEGFALLVGGLSVLAGIPLLFLDQGDASPGAIDNASGVGVVLSLAEALARQPEIFGGIGLSVLITSAEEFGALGAAAFVRQNRAQLRRQDRDGRLYVLNFDGVGVDGKLCWVGKDRRTARPAEASLSALVRQACRGLPIELGRLSLPGALYDHMPFAEAGFEAGSLVAIGPATRAVHTPRDTVDRLHLRGFEQAGAAALEVIRRMTSPYI
jgi:hypothetical protein